MTGDQIFIKKLMNRKLIYNVLLNFNFVAKLMAKKDFILNVENLIMVQSESVTSRSEWQGQFLEML